MSTFLREFEALIAERNCGSATAIFQAAGLNKSTLSRIRNTGFKLQFDDLKRLSAALGGGDLTFLRLLRARLLDECHDPVARRIQIDISGARMPLIQPSSDSLSDLKPAYTRAIRAIIAALPNDPGLRSTLLWLGEMVAAADDPEDGAMTGACPRHIPTALQVNDAANSIPAETDLAKKSEVTPPATKKAVGLMSHPPKNK